MTNANTKAPKSKSHPKWPLIYRRIHRSGQASYVVDLGLIEGKRERYSFRTKEEALTAGEHFRVARQNEGVAAFSISPALRVDAIQANEILAPHGVSLLNAARYYIKHVIAYRTSPTIKEIVEIMVNDAKKNKRRDRTVQDVNNRLSQFAEDFPNRRLSELSVDDLKDWLGDSEWAPRTKINYLTKISQLYNYALKRQWVDANITVQIDRPAVEDAEPEVFTIDQATQLLKHANKHGLLAYIAIGLFAGLRSAELLRLETAAVDIANRSIVVGASVAKKRSRRVVEINDTLVAWLKQCDLSQRYLVNAETFRNDLEALKEDASIEHWPHNGLRHSFASYHIAMYGDSIKTAYILGHKDSVVIHNHYKALVLKSEAEKFWAIRPTADTENNSQSTLTAGR